MKNRTRFAIAMLGVAPSAGFAQTLPPSQDSYYVPSSGTNFGTAPTIIVGPTGGTSVQLLPGQLPGVTSTIGVGLVQFDLTHLPAGLAAGQVQKATLTLFVDTVTSGGTINIDTVSSSTPWGELTVNGNSGISPGNAVATSVPVATVDTFITMDATAAVQGWVTTPSSNNGFMILANGSTSVQFDSKENTSASHPATLTLVLVNSGATGPSGAAGVAGATGATGAASTVPGPSGATGPSGPSGPSGATGPAGAPGPPGVTGLTGATGATGAHGVLSWTSATGFANLNSTTFATVASLTVANTGTYLLVGKATFVISVNSNNTLADVLCYTLINGNVQLDSFEIVGSDNTTLLGSGPLQGVYADSANDIITVACRMQLGASGTASGALAAVQLQ